MNTTPFTSQDVFELIHKVAKYGTVSSTNLNNRQALVARMLVMNAVLEEGLDHVQAGRVNYTLAPKGKDLYENITASIDQKIAEV